MELGNFIYVEPVQRAIREEQDAWQAQLGRTSVLAQQRFADLSYFEADTPRDSVPTVTTPASACPWDGRVISTEGGSVFQFTRVGVLRPAGLPTNMFSDGALWSTGLSGSDYVVLRCFTSGNTVTSCELVQKNSPADPIGIQEGTAPASFEIDLWAVLDGIARKVVECANLTAIPTVALITDAEDPVCAGDPLVRHYTWAVSSSIIAP